MFGDVLVTFEQVFENHSFTRVILFLPLNKKFISQFSLLCNILYIFTREKINVAMVTKLIATFAVKVTWFGISLGLTH